MKKIPLLKRVYVHPAGLTKNVTFLVSVVIFIMGSLSLYSCNQDSIFFQIESEPELKEAKIKGSPTGIVEFGGKLYVGSDKIWGYDGSAWASTNPVSGKKVLGLAATTTYLYALIDAGPNLPSAQLYRKNAASADWKLVHTGALNSIFGAGDTLFAGAGDTVYYIQDAPSVPSPLPSIALSDDPPTYDNRGVLLGAAYFNGNYFISIQSKGVFCANTPTSLGSTAIAGSKDAGNFTGFIVIPDGSSNVLIMVSTTGTFCKITGTSPAIDDTNKWAYSFGFNGAIALYTKDSNQYLLFGLSGSSYGYLELEVPSLLAFTADTKPQGPTISVKDVNTYNASLGTHPVTSLYQAPNTIDSTMPIFASTSLDGLWSCRDGEWNLEE